MPGSGMLDYDSVRYSSLEQQEEPEMPFSSVFEYGTPPDTFKSAFTYANYNDLDRMGYEVPKRYGSKQITHFSQYTYTHRFGEEEDAIGPAPGGILELIIVGVSFVFAILTLPFSLFFTLRFVSETEKLVVLRLGRAQKTRGPGTVFVLPCIDSAYRIDTRVTAFNVPPLHIITADRGLVEIGAVVYLRVRDAIASICQVHDRNNSTRSLANTMLYRYVSKKRICELTGGYDRRMLAASFKQELGQFTSQFGVEITEVELSEMKVIQDAENMALSSLSSVARSEVGQQVWEVIGPVIEEISKEAVEEGKKQREEGGGEGEESSEPECSSLLSFSDVPLPPEDEVDLDRIVTIVNLGIDDSLVVAIAKVFQFDCEGLEGLVVDLRRGICHKGVAPNPDITFFLKRRIVMPLLRQQISPMTAYMDGSLKISGPVQDALSLRLLLDRIVHLL